jgi:dolichyl-phosphate-mannose-protein mannosyltransferase
MARAIGLIVVPFIVYLSFFYIHFAILVQSGSGDLYMSPAFQETLAGNEMLLNSAGNQISLYAVFVRAQ